MSTTADDETTSILIVDDLPEKILVYRSVLEDLGLDIVTASSGHEALKQVLRRDFAVILLDVNMPDIDGFETARLIRTRKASAHTPVIFLTAFADEVRTREGYETGAVDYLPTPVVPAVLRAKVRVFVDLHRMRQQVARQAEEQAKRAAAEEQARRAAFLAEASSTLTSSLDFDATRRGLLRLTVPGLGDLAAVTQAVEAGHDWRSEIAWAEGDGFRSQTLTDEQAPRDALREAHDRVLRSGAPESLDGVDIPYPFGPDAPDRRVRSALLIPLQARGRILGVLTLARSRPGQAWDADEWSLAVDLAGRAAIALDNALLVRSIQENDLRKDEFLAMLAHELRNPLAPIRTGLDLIALTGGDPEIVEPMRRQVEHLVRLVDDLLDVSRITRGAIDLQLQPTDVKKVIAGAVDTSRPLIEARRHELSVVLTPEPLRVKGDPVRLTQVLTNLLNNAAKYTPDGGHISLTAEREGGEVVLRVCDTGMGLSREMLSKVFDLFVQADRSLDRSQGGLGIGLTLVRRLVEMHGGVVEVHSDGPDMGCEFVVRLPACGAERVAPVNGASAPAAAREAVPSRVLVVDDNTDAAATLAMLLRIGGHDVRLAHDGRSALETAAEFMPGVVLLDIGLPGLDGYEVARRLRAKPEHDGVVLIAVSGYGQDEDRRRAYDAGFNHHLTKPVDFAAIREVLPAAVPQPAAT
jgi:signal transduction histidine kinase/DNA-binding response OmpR family regulator